MVILLFSELRCVEVKDELSRFGKCQRFNGAVSRVGSVLFGFVPSCDPRPHRPACFALAVMPRRWLCFVLLVAVCWWLSVLSPVWGTQG